MLKFALSVVALLLLLVGSDASAAAAEAPPKVKECAACHGDVAPSPYPSVPTIHGLPVEVLDNALFDFRATIRPCRKADCGEDADCPELDFCAIAVGLSDEDIATLARWYSMQPFVPAGEAWDAAKAAQGRSLHMAQCESCHTGGGTNPVDQASILRGQPKGYLRLALEDFRNDRRVAVAEMDAIIRELSDREIAALIEFYASPAD